MANHEVQKQSLRWRDLLSINVHWLGISTITGSLTPLLLPYLVALFAPPDRKNTYLATVRVISLALAMMVQPMAGLLSDRSTLRWGRRRPFIVLGTGLTVLSLVVIGLSPRLADPSGEGSFAFLAYAVLLLGIVLWQISSNIGQAALQALVPDLVPRSQRGRVSGIKAVAELLPALPLVLLGNLVDSGDFWLLLGLVAGLLCLTTLVTVLSVKEESQRESPPEKGDRPFVRLAGQALVFVGVTQATVGLVRLGNGLFGRWDITVGFQMIAVGLLGLLGMAVSAFVGVYLGARIALGKHASQQMPFIWWIINRLLFFAAVGSIQGFTLYFLRDVHHVEQVGTLTSILVAVIAVFLLLSALGGGYLADRVGQRRLAILSCLVAAGGAFLLILAPGLPLLVLAACVLGVGTGAYWATSWALGTQLVPRRKAGRYLGIANLAGAGAGIVGVGIGGPMADLINGLRPGAGYLVTFAANGVLLLLSAAALSRVPRTAPS